MTRRAGFGRRPGRGRLLGGHAGLTTIELMLAGTLALVVVMGISLLPGSILRHFREGAERLRLQQNVHRTAQRMGIEVRRAAAFQIYDPAHPATPLAAGPAVALLDTAGVRFEGFQASGDGKALLNDAGQPIDDMTLSDLWFESGPGGELVLRLAFTDRNRNETALLTSISTRN